MWLCYDQSLSALLKKPSSFSRPTYSPQRKRGPLLQTSQATKQIHLKKETRNPFVSKTGDYVNHYVSKSSCIRSL